MTAELHKNTTEVDITSKFGTYQLGCRSSLARRISNRLHTKPLINLVRAIGGLRSCKIADVNVYGGRMRVYPGLNRSDKIMLGMPQMFDCRERKLLAEALKETANPIFVDIGANIGAYSLFVNSLGLNSRIISIEADPEMFARLNYNLPDNIIKLNMAVADKECTLPFYINERNRGENSLIDSGGKKIEVPAKRLSKILEENNVSKPTAFKIDVEGAEYIILSKYFEETAPENFPDLIILEHLHTQDLQGILAGYGYKPLLKTKLNIVMTKK